MKPQYFITVLFSDGPGGDLQVLLQRVVPLFNDLKCEDVRFEKTKTGRWHMHANCLLKPSVPDIKDMQQYPWWAHMRTMIAVRKTG